RARIAQSSAFPTVADEPASPGRDDSPGEACPTVSGFIADQDRATIAKSSTLPHDSAPRVTSHAAGEGRGGDHRLKERVKYLEDKEEVIGDKSGDGAPIKERRSNEGEAAAERISTDSEEIARVLTSLDATNVLAGETNVPTDNGSIPTAGPPAAIVSTASEVGPTASPTVRRRKGKEILVESDTPKKKKLHEQIDAQMARELEEQQEREDLRMNEQIARDAEVARIHAEEEIQAMIDSLDKSNETVAKYLEEYQQFASDLSLEKKMELINQDRATIAKSSTLPHDSAPRVTSPAADEGSMQQNISELTALCTSLQRQYSELMSKFQAQEEEIGRLKERVQVLEDREAVASKPSGEDAPIKGRSNNEGEAAAERISNDSKEIAKVLTSMDAATILAEETNVPTGSGFIPTAGPPATVISTGSEVGHTASPIVTRRKGKEVMVESDTPKKKKLQEQIDAQVARELEEQQEREDMRMNEQIVKDAEVVRIHAEEEIQEDPDLSFQHKDQELEAHYMYMAQIQEDTPDAADNSRPIFDTKTLQKVLNNDNYNVFAIESEHPEQSKSVHGTYSIEQDEYNVIIDLLDMSYDREQIDHDDDDLANERDLLAFLIEKLKCENDDSKNRNKYLETSNKEANNELPKINELMYKDLKKFQAELDRDNDVKYASKVEIDCAKAKGDSMSYKMEFEKSSNRFTQKINNLNQTISKMKKEMFTHQETISILSQKRGSD
nr:hypothetical protein [Tanacetum cinerariifolium]